MGTVDPIRDYEDRAVRLLPAALRKRVNCGLAIAIGAVWQCVEDTCNSVESSLRYKDATGFTLEIFGNLLGEPRAGLSDEDYRRVIDAKILANKSRGTTDDLIRIVQAVSPPGSRVEAFLVLPAGLWIQVISPTPAPPQFLARIRALIADSGKPGGVSVTGVWAVSNATTRPFGFEGNDAPTDGYNVGEWSTLF